MRKLFVLEVTESNMKGIIPGDEVIVDPNVTPEGNGRDIGVFAMNGSHFISRFTRYGNRLILLQENGPYQIVRSVDVDVIGTVIGGSMEMEIEEASAVTEARHEISLHA